MSKARLLDPRVATAFYGRFHRLRESQEAAIEPLLSGGNVVLASGTGSGKTEAVVAPLLSRHWLDAAQTETIALLYVAPTKALVNDLEKRLAPPLASLGLQVGVRHGDRDDLKTARRPCILVTTPESLDVMLFRNEPALHTVRCVVVDEVHLLYNTQRGLQLSILLRRLSIAVGKPLQWAMLSATIGRLSDVRDFLMGASEEASFLKYPAQRTIDAHIRNMPSETAFLELVQKLIAGHPTKLLIFANARRECERLAGILHRDHHLRHITFAHYSSLSPDVRVDTERKFAVSNTAICIATSTLELGIDIGDIDAVLLWGVPGGVESFLQRIGRGNRRACKANVICLVPDTSGSIVGEVIQFAALIDAAKNGDLPIRAPYDLFGAVGQQCLSVIASKGGQYTRVADLCELVRHRPSFERPVIESILGQLAATGYLKKHGFKNRFGADERLHQLVDYQLIYGNFGASSQVIGIYYSSKHLGDVPFANLLRIHAGQTVRFAGAHWRIRKVSRDGIVVEPARPSQHAIDFTYSSGGVRLDPFVAGRAWDLMHSGLLDEQILSPSIRQKVATAINGLRRVCGRSQIPYYRTIDGLYYFTFAGYLVNKAIGLITGKAGFEASDAVLKVLSPVDWAKVPATPQEYTAVFELLFEQNDEQSIYQQQLPAGLQLREFIQDWLRDETVKATLTRLASATTVPVDASVLSSFV